MYLRTHYSTVVLSDIHLGTKHSKTEEVTHFLKSISCDRLILNGDIIDGWYLRKNRLRSKWKSKHTEFFKVIMEMMNCGTQVIYVRGNHDDFLDNVVPLCFYNIQIVKEYVYESHGRRYFVTHGDIFDTLTTRIRWMAKLGDAGYTFLLWLNKAYNIRKMKQGKNYCPLSQSIKNKVKKSCGIYF